jgi:hypothetical protein
MTGEPLAMEEQTLTDETKASGAVRSAAAPSSGKSPRAKANSAQASSSTFI